MNISFGKKSDSGKKDFFHLEFYFGQGIEIFAFSKTSASKQLNLAEADVLQFCVFSFSMQNQDSK